MSPKRIQAKYRPSEDAKADWSVMVEDLQLSPQTETLGMYLASVVQLGTDYKIEVSIIVVRQKPISDNSTR